MRYVGGKAKLAKKLVQLLQPLGGPYWSPFCGGLSVESQLGLPGIVSDISQPLISMYCAVQKGWVPPDKLGEREYQKAKLLPDTDPLKAFAGFGCAFGGKYFDTYARASGGRRGGAWAIADGADYVGAAKRAVMRDVPRVINAGGMFRRFDFMKESPCDGYSFLYLDPPYQVTEEKQGAYYPGVPQFDSKAFFELAWEWGTYTDVYISEYASPIGEVVLAHHQRKQIAATGAPAVEKVFHVKRRY